MTYGTAKLSIPSNIHKHFLIKLVEHADFHRHPKAQWRRKHLPAQLEKSAVGRHAGHICFVNFNLERLSSKSFLYTFAVVIRFACMPHSGVRRLKGNQVEVLNSPAAVSSIMAANTQATEPRVREGVRCGTSQKTCRYTQSTTRWLSRKGRERRHALTSCACRHNGRVCFYPATLFFLGRQTCKWR